MATQAIKQLHAQPDIDKSHAMSFPAMTLLPVPILTNPTPPTTLHIHKDCYARGWGGTKGVEPTPQTEHTPCTPSHCTGRLSNGITQNNCLPSEGGAAILGKFMRWVQGHISSRRDTVRWKNRHIVEVIKVLSHWVS